MTQPPSLADRQAAVAAAFRTARSLPRRATAAVQPSADRQTRARGEVDALRTELRRLTERLERVESKVDLIRDAEDAPLTWPVPVETDNRLEVPPLEVKRSNSPAFDILLGPARRDSA